MPSEDIAIGIIGMGAMGKGLLHQSAITPGVRCVSVCDLDQRKCVATRESEPALCSGEEQCSRKENYKGLDFWVRECGEDIARSSAIHVVIEASSGISSAIDHCIATLEAHKHLVLMNAEIDLTYGPLLGRIARDNKVVSTSCGGDQYGVIKNLLDEIEGWGFELVMAGNIKGFLDRYANPESIIPEADKRNLDYRMCTSYTDGSKLNIEMAIVANAYGMVPPSVGMTGPRLDHVAGVFDVFDFASLWRQKTPLVDYVLGAEPGGGVFAIGHCGHTYQREMLSYYKMGAGPFYLFYRPYHLCHIEAMDAVLRAAQKGEAFMEPVKGLITNVYAYAKKDLMPGDQLDGLGGFCLYGLIETVTSDARVPGIPICLADDISVRSPIRKDSKILLTDLDINFAHRDLALYQAALAI